MNYKKPRPYTPPISFNRTAANVLNKYIKQNTEEELKIFFDDKDHRIYAFKDNSVMIAFDVPSLESSEKLLNITLPLISEEVKKQMDNIIIEADNLYVSTGYEVLPSGKRHLIDRRYRIKNSYYEYVDYKNKQLKYFHNKYKSLFVLTAVDLYSGQDIEKPFVLKNKNFAFVFPSETEPLMMVDTDTVFELLKKENSIPNR